MTTADSNVKPPKPKGRFRLPDPPEHPDDKMTNAKHLSETGNHHHLAQHLGSPGTTIVSAERYLVVRPTRTMAGSLYPDLLVAFGTDPAAYEASNGYIIEEQGKPPDFVLEIASPNTGRVDVGEKRIGYAELGIQEYWRFDETGQHHGARLAGDRLVGGTYEPMGIDELDDSVLQGYSTVLNLNLRWVEQKLAFYDPATGLHIATFESERARADTAEARADTAEERADRERERADTAEAGRNAAETRVRELEEELRRWRSG